MIKKWLNITGELIVFILCITLQSGNKKDAERLVKNIIKIVIKIGVLHRNNQFSADETKAADRFRQKFLVSKQSKQSIFYSIFK